jgi:hypothetical protein
MIKRFVSRATDVRFALTSLALVATALGTGGDGAAAGQLVLDFGETGPIACGDAFELGGLDCRTEPISETPCYADDFHGTLLLSWAALVIEIGELSQISHLEALVETRIEPSGSTVFGVFDGDDPVTYVVGTVSNSPELLEVDTTGLVFDTIRLSGLTLTVAELRIDSPVPLEAATWSTIKGLYR